MNLQIEETNVGLTSINMKSALILFPNLDNPFVVLMSVAYLLKTKMSCIISHLVAHILLIS